VIAISYKDEERKQLKIDVNRSDDKSWWSFTKDRKNRSRHNSLESIIRRDYLSIKKQCTRKGGILLDSDSTIKKHGVDYKNVGKDFESQRWKVILRGWNIMQKE
jgi:hypothetical protein